MTEIASTNGRPALGTQLRDSYGRVARDLRISVTDRCNMRCVYCMPEEGMPWFPRDQVVTYEEIARFARIAVGLGVTDIRLTGGEPLVRRGLPELVAMLAEIEGVQDLSMTTNGILLPEHARALRDAGLQRVNVSLDSLRPDVFARLTRRETFDQVFAGLRAAREVGFEPIKINVVAIRGYTEHELVDLARFGRDEGYIVRFIEFMPLDADLRWDRESTVLPADEIVAAIDAVYPLERVPATVNEPAVRYRFRDGAGEIGVIASVTAPFCETCDRVRLTADGKLLTCLFATWDTDIKGMMRAGASDDEIAATVVEAVGRKDEGHMINTARFERPGRTMSRIGG